MSVDYLSSPTDRGDVFVSDFLDGAFRLALKSFALSTFGTSWSSMQSLPGTFIAQRERNDDAGKETVITHDMGHTWSTSSVQVLQGADTILGTPIAPKGVTGLIAGLGQFATSLDPQREVQTVVSRDAGLTWSPVLGTPHALGAPDYGNPFIAIPMHTDFSEVRISTDEGLTWTSVSLNLNQTIRLSQLWKLSNTRFLIAGTNVLEDTETETLLVSVDVAPAPRVCTDDDYEIFRPAVCILGLNETYRRRKPSSNCNIDTATFNRVVSSVPCPCERRDFGCSECYQPSVDDPLTCVPVPSKDCSSAAPLFSLFHFLNPFPRSMRKL